MTNNIYTLLSEYRLGEAIEALQSKVESIRDVSVTGQFYTLLDNYRAYIRVQMQQLSTCSTAETEPFYRQAYSVNDRANRRIRLFKAPNDQYSLAVNSADGMFERIWTSDLWDDKEKADIDSFAGLCPERMPVVVSAVTLALCEMFDEKKLMYLFDAYEHPDQVVSLRALIGLIIILRRYDSRIVHYPQIASRLSLLSERPSFVRQFFNAHVILQYSRMTESVSDKMRNDIIPILIKSTRLSKGELGIDEIDRALSGNGENPDWIRNASDDKIEKKIQQMAKMQTEGADIYMTTFRHMKSFPFFNKVQNWFEPFSFSHPELRNCKSSTLIDGILGITPFCDSDKYSFVLMLSQMGDSSLNAITSQIEQQLPEDMSINDIVTDAGKDKDALVSGKNAEGIMRRYAQDLYRFFTIYPYHAQFFNPFDEKLSAFTPLHRDSFKSLLGHSDQLLTVAEFFMRKGLYHDALEMFRMVEPATKDDDRAELLQKIGFCEQKTGNYTDAYCDLVEADSIKPRTHWTVSHLFQIAFELKMYDEAMRYLDMLMEDNPDELRLIIKKAECLLALDNFRDAIPILYKVVYLDDGLLVGHQMLAWALLMAGSYDKSAKEYTKCLELEDCSAWIYLGHLALLSDEAEKACGYYRQALNFFCAESANQQEGREKFFRSFWNPVKHIPSLNHQVLKLLFDQTLLT